jgi:hypothetical protein
LRWSHGLDGFLHGGLVLGHLIWVGRIGEVVTEDLDFVGIGIVR